MLVDQRRHARTLHVVVPGALRKRGSQQLPADEVLALGVRFQLVAGPAEQLAFRRGAEALAVSNNVVELQRATGATPGAALPFPELVFLPRAQLRPLVSLLEQKLNRVEARAWQALTSVRDAQLHAPGLDLLPILGQGVDGEGALGHLAHAALVLHGDARDDVLLQESPTRLGHLLLGEPEGTAELAMPARGLLPLSRGLELTLEPLLAVDAPSPPHDAPSHVLKLVEIGVLPKHAEGQDGTPWLPGLPPHEGMPVVQRN